MKRTLPIPLLLAALAGCAAPGLEQRPLPTDFAFVQIQLQG